jgi:ABC-type nitrate/sulfonate/bicarbonate transport system permease component
VADVSLAPRRNVPLEIGIAPPTLLVLSLAFGLILWELLSRAFASILLPSPVSTFSAFIERTRSGQLPAALGTTLLHLVLGLTLGCGSGVLLGLLIGSIRFVRLWMEPYLNFFRFIASVAWVGPAQIWFGLGLGPILFLVFYTTVFIVALNVVDGFTRIHRDRVRMARMFGAGRWEVFGRIVLPSIVPFAVTGIRIAMGNGFATTVSAEILIGGQFGLGYEIYNSRLTFSADVMFACIFLLGIFGYLADRAFVLLETGPLRRYRAAR